MYAIQTLNELPLDKQADYVRSFEARKKTGLSDAEIKIFSTVESNFKENIALAKSDPNQLAINQGLFKNILDMQDANGQTDFKSLLGELKFRASEGADKMFVQYQTNGKSILSNAESTQLADELTKNTEIAPIVIRQIYGTVGEQQANNIFKEMYPKKSNGIIYASVIGADKPVVAEQIINGINMIKNGATLETDDKRDLDDFFKSDIAINRLGDSAPGIRQAIEGYYYSMDKKDIDEAVRKVTNGIDNGVLMYKETDEDGKPMTYSKVVKNMKKVINHRLGYDVNLKFRLNGEPQIGVDTFIQNFDDYDLVSVSARGYAFKNSVTGDYLTTRDGGKLVYTFRKDQ